MKRKIKDRRAYFKARRLMLRQQGLCDDCAKHIASFGANRCRVCLFRNFAKKHLGGVGWWRLLVKIWVKQRGRCAYTHRKLTLGVDASIDHVVPKDKQGSLDLKNIRWVHLDVNIAKHSKSLDEFLSLCKDVLIGFGYEVGRKVDDNQIKKEN